MRIDVLVVPDCPNGPVVIERLAQALDGRDDVQVAPRPASRVGSIRTRQAGRRALPHSRDCARP